MAQLARKPEMEQVQPAGPEEPTKEEKTWASLMHASLLLGIFIPFAGFVAPFAMWLIKKDESKFIYEQGIEVFNFYINIAIAGIISALLVFVLIGYPLLLAVAAVGIIMPILAAVRVSQGEYYQYPYLWRPIKTRAKL